jgi:ATP-binding cassette subfamily A (ABC1) protein 3
MLPGVKFCNVKKEAEQLIKDFDLEEKRDYPAGKLSGGQKRKLSIAIALIGGSRVVFLDEPSAGMDPEARRVVWDNLVKYKQGRVIILTSKRTLDLYLMIEC